MSSKVSTGLHAVNLCTFEALYCFSGLHILFASLLLLLLLLLLYV
jgi:hypothetical protein